MGPIVLRRRADPSGPACRRGHCPAAAALGQGARDLRPGVSLAGAVAGVAAAATERLPKVAGLRLAEAAVERTTEVAGGQLGAALAAGRTCGKTADWPRPADAHGRPTASVRIDAPGIGMPGPGGVAADGRMASVDTILAPRPEPGDDEAAGRRPAAVERARYLAGSYAPDGLGAPLRRQAAPVGGIGPSDGSP